MHADVCPGKAELHNLVHMAGHMSAERGRERHPPGPVLAATDFTPTHRHPDYSERLCKPPAPSPSLLTTSSPMQASPPQALIQTLAQTRASQGQSCPCTSPTTITSPSQLLHPKASKHTLPRKPQHLPGCWAGALGRLARHLGGCRHFPGAPQTDTERGWSDAPR